MEALAPIETRAMSEKSHLEENPNWRFLSLTPLFLRRRVEKGESSVCLSQLSRTSPAKHIYWRKRRHLRRKRELSLLEPLVKVSRPRDKNIRFLFKRNCSCWTLPMITVKYWGGNTLKSLWCFAVRAGFLLPLPHPVH